MTRPKPIIRINKRTWKEKYFPSGKAAAAGTRHADPANICACANGKNGLKSHAGYQWRFATAEDVEAYRNDPTAFDDDNDDDNDDNTNNDGDGDNEDDDDGNGIVAVNNNNDDEVANNDNDNNDNENEDMNETVNSNETVNDNGDSSSSDPVEQEETWRIHDATGYRVSTQGHIRENTMGLDIAQCPPSEQRNGNVQVRFGKKYVSVWCLVVETFFDKDALPKGYNCENRRNNRTLFHDDNKYNCALSNLYPVTLNEFVKFYAPRNNVKECRECKRAPDPEKGQFSENRSICGSCRQKAFTELLHNRANEGQTRECGQCHLIKRVDKFKGTLCDTCRAQITHGRVAAKIVKSGLDTASYAIANGKFKPFCGLCKKAFTQEAFPLRPEYGSYRGTCQACINNKKYYVAYVEKCRRVDLEGFLERIATRGRLYRHNNPEKAQGYIVKQRTDPHSRLLIIRNSARIRSIEFIDSDMPRMEAKLREPCFYCGAPALIGIDSIGLDRVDNHQGYTDANTVACCKVCNYIKFVYPLEVLCHQIREICTARQLNRLLCTERSNSNHMWERGNEDRKKSFLSSDQKKKLRSEPCYLCGVDNAGGIDRVDSSCAYTIENSKPCCCVCNYMKKNMSLDMFLKQVQYMYFRIDDIEAKITACLANDMVVNKKAVEADVNEASVRARVLENMGFDNEEEGVCDAFETTDNVFETTDTISNGTLDSLEKENTDVINSMETFTNANDSTSGNSSGQNSGIGKKNKANDNPEQEDTNEKPRSKRQKRSDSDHQKLMVVKDAITEHIVAKYDSLKALIAALATTPFIINGVLKDERPWPAADGTQSWKFYEMGFETWRQTHIDPALQQDFEQRVRKGKPGVHRNSQSIMITDIHTGNILAVFQSLEAFGTCIGNCNVTEMLQRASKNGVIYDVFGITKGVCEKKPFQVADFQTLWIEAAMNDQNRKKMRRT